MNCQVGLLLETRRASCHPNVMSNALAVTSSTSRFRSYKTLKLREQDEKLAKHFESAFDLRPGAARILAERNPGDDEQVEHYLKPTLSRGIPHPRGVKNLMAACMLIEEVSKDGGSIAICCDFDVDGLSGGAQALHFLQAAGIKAQVYVPNRFTDGYGLNTGMVEKAAADGHKLLFTIDFGTTNTPELLRARELGMKTIVLDHHHVEHGPPECDIFINPQQEGCGFADGILCASGLVWFLLAGLRSVLPSAKDIDVKTYLDLACLGTICDMVPLIGVNRILAKRGLEMIARSKRRGIVALKEVIGVKHDVRCSHVSFGIGPRLNAAGRMVDGELVIKLLTTTGGDVAKKLARKLNILNSERQDIEAAVKEEAVAQIESLDVLPAGLVASHKDFHTGVIGIVAQRLVENFYRPSAVLGYENGFYKGSVRGISGVSVVELLSECSEVLAKYGGHEGAGGFSVREEKLEDFRELFVKACEKRLGDTTPAPVAKADTSCELSEVTPELIKELKSFEPYGVGNPQPQILLKDLKVMDKKILKNAHTKVTLSDGKHFINGMMWRETEQPVLEPGNVVNVVCKPDLNNFRGMQELQAIIQAAEIA